MSRNLAKHTSLTLLSAAGLTLALVFQNCGTQSVIENHSASAEVTAESNGSSGPQGKMYVHMGQCGAQPWAEKSRIIVSLDGTEAREIINDCMKLPLPNSIPIPTIYFDTDSLLYMKLVYVYIGTTDNPMPLPTPAPVPGGTPTNGSTTPPTAASLNLCQTTTARVIFHCKDRGSSNTTLTGFQSSSGSYTGIACVYSGTNSSSFSSPMQLTRDATGRIVFANATSTSVEYELMRAQNDTGMFEYKSSTVNQSYFMTCTEYP